MLDQVLDFFDIVPDIRVDLTAESRSLAGFTAEALTELDRVVESTGPGAILVEGDAAGTMVGALAGFYHQVPVGHIEARAGRGDTYLASPEQVNRRIIGTIAEWHFVPTKHARAALLKEGVAERSVYVTGNTAIDALLMAKKQLSDCQERDFSGSDRRIILVIADRRESLGEPLTEICRALAQVVGRNPDVEAMLPMDPSPRVRVAVNRVFRGKERVRLYDPLRYGELLSALVQSHLILTDSGSIEEEASAPGKPVLVVREKTERVEAVEAGVAKLAGTDVDKIAQEGNASVMGGKARSSIVGRHGQDARATPRDDEALLPFLSAPLSRPGGVSSPFSSSSPRLCAFALHPSSLLPSRTCLHARE
jgi:UDP-N-acetylglucosamine 2-epimerase (non-hydrolysing)